MNRPDDYRHQMVRSLEAAVGAVLGPPQPIHDEPKTEFEVFRNRMRALLLIRRGDVPALTSGQWRMFSNSPHNGFMRLDDDAAEEVFNAILRRERDGESNGQTTE